MSWFTLIPSVLFLVFHNENVVVGKPVKECPLSDTTTWLQDSEFCDVYYICQDGRARKQVCPNGLMFLGNRCEYQFAVNCAGRSKTQPPISDGKGCQWQNGFFPAEGTCTKFWFCSEGKGEIKDCPATLVFEPKLGICVFPDQSSRPECNDKALVPFFCPVYPPEARLRFGDHDRLPDPKDCRNYFVCLRNGSARKHICGAGTAFHPTKGICEAYTDLPSYC